MTDRELLELAAKAAGRKLVWMGEGSYVPDGLGLKRFDPLTDDGDRYRLAKACNLDINFANKTVTAFRDGHVHCCYYFGDHPDDEARNIVRAAASIGGQKP